MKFYKTIVRPLIAILRPDQFARSKWIIGLMVFNALLDFFSLASFLPLIILIVNPGFISSNSFVNTLYESTGFSTPSGFIIFLTLSVLAFVVIKNIFSVWITKVKANYVFTLGSKLSSSMLSRYMEISYLKFTQTDFTRELNRIANQPIAFANNIVMPLANLISEGIVLLLLLLCVAFYNLNVFGFILILLIPVALLYRSKRKNIRETSRELKEQYPLTLKYALQVVEGINEMKSFGKESFFKSKFRAATEILAGTFTRDHVTQTSTTRLTEIITALIVCSLVIYSILQNQSYQQTVLLLGVYAGASFRIIPSLNRIFHASLQIKTHEYLFQELELSKLVPQENDSQSGLAYEFSDTIEFKNISFQYPNGPNVLRDVSMTIHKGEKLALVGRSGSGKTTLLLILLQFLKGYTGTILVDGRETGLGDRGRLSKIFGYVPQNPYILDGTILENIAFGLPANEIDHGKILQLVHDLDLADMLAKLPNGIGTHIGEKGMRLSGGQRQRIAIARALYADREVLVLDEITNQLDALTEQEIVKTLEKDVVRKKTIIMITHHTALLNRFNRVLTLDDGILTEDTSIKVPSTV